MMKVVILGLAILFALMAVAPVAGSAFAVSTTPVPDDEGTSDDDKTCPFSGKKMTSFTHTSI